MNTPNIKSSGMTPMNNITNATPNRKGSLSQKPHTLENNAAQSSKARHANKAEIMSSLKENSKKNGMGSKIDEDSPEINEYLKMVSRLENKIKLGEIKKEDLDKLLQALEERILELNEQDKQKLLNIEFFKQHKIENLHDLKDKLSEMFDNKRERDSFFDFLKNPEFISILIDQNEPINAYGPPKHGTLASSSSDAGTSAKTSRQSPKV